MSEFCTVYGHEYYRLPCRGCRSEALAAGVDQLAPAVPAVTSRDASHASHIRTLTREPDPRERAAGEATNREDD